MNTYKVNDQHFDKFSEAVKFAKTQPGSIVYELAYGEWIELGKVDSQGNFHAREDWKVI